MALRAIQAKGGLGRGNQYEGWDPIAAALQALQAKPGK
jgi:hypothetical protein